jgi:hypothetical protein
MTPPLHHHPHPAAIGFAIPTVLMALAIAVLCVGAVARLYTYAPPEGSPLLRVARVLRGAWRNRRLPLPAPSELFGARAPSDPPACFTPPYESNNTHAYNTDNKPTLP